MKRLKRATPRAAAAAPTLSPFSRWLSSADHRAPRERSSGGGGVRSPLSRSAVERRRRVVSVHQETRARACLCRPSRDRDPDRGRDPDPDRDRDRNLDRSHRRRPAGRARRAHDVAREQLLNVYVAHADVLTAIDTLLAARGVVAASADGNGDPAALGRKERAALLEDPTRRVVCC